MASGFESVPLTSQKHDPAWKHCQMFKNGERVQLKCLYCGKVFKGGGIHRIKEHLAGQKGNASTCLRVQPDVRLLMQESLNSAVAKKRKKQKISSDEIVDYNPSTSEMDTFANTCDINTEVTLITVPETIEPDSTFLIERGDETVSKAAGRKKKGRIRKAPLSITPCGGNNGTLGGSKRATSQVSMAIGRFFYDVGIPLDAVKSDYFQPMIDAIASQEEGAVGPTYHDLRNCVLKNSLQEVRNEVDQCIGTWGKSGCSVLVDEWLSEKGRTFANFLVYCPEGITFLRSVDISDILNSPDALCTLLKGVVEEVGTRNVLQVVTNTEERYAVAAKRLSDDLPSVFWTPCASQCINSILEDFKRLDWINTIIEQAQYISRSIYNNNFVLNMMRRYTFGVDLLDTGATPLAADFATIKRMVQIKHNLQSMVTSEEWMESPYSKMAEGFEMLDHISSQTFWSSCIMIVQLTDPLLRLLRLVSSEKRPAMGYVYAGVFRAKEAIKKQLVDPKEYLVYWNIIDQRLGKLQNHPLHVAGFYFNPKFYIPLTKDVSPNIPSPVFDCIEKLVPDPKVQDEIVKEMASYRSGTGDFGREMAKRAKNTLHPEEWWSTYGGGCPNLTRLAIHILSQTCSLVVPKPNFNIIQQMHETNNSLEHQRLSDLVYVHYNLLLGQPDRKNREHDLVDPIASENMAVVGDWVTEKGHSKEFGSSDWMAVDPPLGNTMLLGLSSDDIEDLGSKFEDCEIFNVVKDEEAGGENLAEHV